MRAKWDNLFWYQRASDDGKEQLENNTTKGFLKVLQELDDRLTDEFLKQFLDLNIEDSQFEYDVQIGLDDIPTSEHIVHLVGLSYEGENTAREAEPRSGDGTVDGVITVHSEDFPTTIVLEVKTGRDPLKRDQMGKYRGELGIEEDRLCHGVRWMDVYRHLEAHQDDTKNEVDQFLLGEFTDYLELMKMVPFRGFDREKLRGPGKVEYWKSINRGVDTNNPGTFSQALFDERDSFGLDNFTAISQQQSREVHLIDEEAYEDGIHQRLRHFSAGFWKQGKFSVQLYLPNRIVSNIVRRRSPEIQPGFERVMIDVLPELDDIKLTRDDNPFYYIRYQRNIQQDNHIGRETTTFPTDTVMYMPGLSEQGIRDRLAVIGQSVRETTDASVGNEKSFVIEKQVPFDSDIIEQEELVEWTMEYFDTLLPVYEYFGD